MFTLDIYFECTKYLGGLLPAVMEAARFTSGRTC